MAASLLSRAATAVAALRGVARPNHLLARASLPKETLLRPLLLLLLLLLTTSTLLAGRVGWAARTAEGAGGSRCGPSPLLGAFGIAARCNATSSSSAVSEAAGVHSLPRTEPVVSAEWLHANLKDPDVKVLDASWYMPAEQRNPLQEYQVAHIPGALFFDVDGISDRTSSLPHMLPSEKAFSAAVSALGIYNKDGIVVYDGKGLFSAARVWWMFRVFGHDKVWVLDGGLPQWRASGYDVESSASSDAILKASAAVEAIEKVYQGQLVGPATFEAKLQPHLLWSLDQVKENINTQTHQLIDARSKPRFDGAVPEPRKGIRSGHVPGSKCVPFPQDGELDVLSVLALSLYLGYALSLWNLDGCFS
ncbi:thiosulfate/3-mercaptopyruvate sulfurtransferase 1, mitochondrial-like isoform X2 [Miscanthus floridulus]|uniref:thiosulfate/3-mercaptopyruvate sulfurtransferase 1, mitochondrial-like isoform X2 n=1 Tax=Miscanthus floridulus TaxID=154761 RepID=UPI003457C944